MWLTTGALDFSGATNITLSFQRWLGIESSSFDQARIELSTNNGSTWSTIWAHSGAALNDRSWQSVSYSLPTAAGASAVLVRWGLGPTDSSVTYGGWNLDDIVFTGIAPPNDPPCPADFDGSGFVDSDDFVEFNAMFELGDPAADADGSTFVDSDDFVFFLQQFTLGCVSQGEDVFGPNPTCVKSADFDGTGFIDADDFVAFLAAFQAGC
jgi:hypothetical protein